MTGQWIGPDDSLAVGQVGFLIENHHTLNGWRRHTVRDTPARTNQSQMPLLRGWCGTYNDVSTRAHGVVRVGRAAKNGRAYVHELTGADLAAALDEMGYPELYPG